MIRCLLLALVAVALAAIEAPTLPKPSGDAGRTGTYEVTCATPGYSYFVSVPKRADDAPDFGLHLFFHGQNNQFTAPEFGNWEGPLLNRHGLIGINMRWADGDNSKDTAGKVAAARAAALQVMADYPVVPGRGMVACFSGGGMPFGQWYEESAGERGLAWPFTAQAMYSSFMRSEVRNHPDTGWLFAVNQEEWGMGGLGKAQVNRFVTALGHAATSGPDHRLFILPKIGHTIDRREPEAAGELFRRIDLAYAPFIHVGTFPAALHGIINQANAGQLGAAHAALKKSKAPAAAVAAVRARIERRAADQLALLGELVERDPLLAAWYCQRFETMLAGTPGAAKAKGLAAALMKKKAHLAAHEAQQRLIKELPKALESSAVVAEASVPVLKEIRDAAGKTSTTGVLVDELLANVP